LTSSAGTPLIADPGFKLVRECLKQGIKVESIPGPSAVLAALACSGLPTDKFLFLGYLPKKPGKRKKLLKNLLNIYQYMLTTTVIYLSPHRLLKELSDIQEIFGEIEVVVCRELTKIHEEIRREKISQSIAHFEKIKPKGEFSLVFRI
jgi:16S rRNA (cytidine1402-2'-O)-methyltransferase